MVASLLLESLSRQIEATKESQTIDKIIKEVCIDKDHGEFSNNLAHKFHEAFVEIKKQLGITKSMLYIRNRYEHLKGNKVWPKPWVQQDVPKPLTKIVAELENKSKEELLFLQATINLLLK